MNTQPDSNAGSGCSSHALFGIRTFERDRIKHAQFMADQVTDPHGSVFNTIAERAWTLRPKKGKRCGQEIFRLRAFEHLQNAVRLGMCRKIGKLYLPNAELSDRHE